MTIYTVTVEEQIRMNQTLSQVFDLDQQNPEFEEYKFELKGVRGYNQPRVKGQPSFNKGIPMSPERLEIHRKAMIGHKVTDEARAKMRAAKLGKTPKQNKEKGFCPNCGKEGQLLALKRWHFDNCKLRK